MAMSPVAEMFISSYGWRDSYIIMGLMVLTTCIICSLLLQHDPYRKGLMPDGEHREPVESDFALRGLTFRTAVQTWKFWLTCIIFATYFFCIQIVLVHVVPYATDIGISPESAALILTVAGGSSIIGRLLMGFTCDRYGSKAAVIACFGVFVVSFIMLLWAEELWFLYLFAFVYGISHGGFIAIISPLIADLFGTRSHGILLGVAVFCGTVGGAIGPLLAGYVFDVTASYRWAFIIMLAVSFAGLVLGSLLKPARRNHAGESFTA
jgi:MFS family permease